MTSLRLVAVLFLVCATVALPAFYVWRAVTEVVERVV